MLCKNNDFEHAHLKRFLVPFFRQKKVHARFEISEKMSIFRVGGALNSQPLNQVNISQWRYLNQRFRTLLRGCRLPNQRFGLHRKTTIYLFTNLFNCDRSYTVKGESHNTQYSIWLRLICGRLKSGYIPKKEGGIKAAKSFYFI